MKVKVTEMVEPVKFIPLKMEIVIETQKERDMLCALGNHNNYQSKITQDEDYEFTTDELQIFTSKLFYANL